MKTLTETQFAQLEGKTKSSPVVEVDEEMNTQTQPMPLPETALERRYTAAMTVIERDYKRIHDVLKSFWGHRDFGDYIRQLIMSGGDGMGQNRIGFKRETVAAMMVLNELHETQHGNA